MSVDDDTADEADDPTVMLALAALRAYDDDATAERAASVAALGDSAADAVFDVAEQRGLLSDPRVVDALRGSRLGAQRRLAWAARHPDLAGAVLDGVSPVSLVAAVIGVADTDVDTARLARERALAAPEGIWAQCLALLRAAPTAASLRLLSRFGDTFFDQLAAAELQQCSDDNPLDGDVELFARVAQTAPVSLVEDLLGRFDFAAATRSARQLVFRPTDRYRPCRAERLCELAVDWADVGSDDPRLVPRWMVVDKLVELFPWEFVEHAELIRSVLDGRLDAVKILDSELVETCRGASDTWDAYTAATSSGAASVGLRDHEMAAVRQLCMFELGRHRDLDHRVAVDVATVQPAKTAAPFLLGVEASPVRRDDRLAAEFGAVVTPERVAGIAAVCDDPVTMVAAFVARSSVEEIFGRSELVALLGLLNDTVIGRTPAMVAPVAFDADTLGAWLAPFGPINWPLFEQLCSDTTTLDDVAGCAALAQLP